VADLAAVPWFVITVAANHKRESGGGQGQVKGRDAGSGRRGRIMG